MQLRVRLASSKGPAGSGNCGVCWCACHITCGVQQLLLSVDSLKCVLLWLTLFPNLHLTEPLMCVACLGGQTMVMCMCLSRYGCRHIIILRIT